MGRISKKDKMIISVKTHTPAVQNENDHLQVFIQLVC